MGIPSIARRFWGSFIVISLIRLLCMPQPSDRESPTEKKQPYDDDELIRARRALRTASWLAVFYLITTDILGPYNAPFAFSQVGYVPGAVLYVVSKFRSRNVSHRSSDICHKC